jgi:hypothetical protein
LDHFYVILNTVVPVFSIVALGFVLGGFRLLDVKTISNLSLWIAAPALIFTLLAETDVGLRQWRELGGGVLFILALTAVAVWLYRRRSDAGRGLYLPVLFWNAGNMALPCAALAFGPEGLRAAAIVFVIVATLQAILGIWIAKGSGGWREAFRLPLLYASVAGLTMSLGEITLPKMILEPLSMLGHMAIPLMLLNLGLQLRLLQIDEVRHSLVAVALRIVLGGAAGYLYVELFSIDGVHRQVLLLESIMPAAVINILFAQRYDADASTVASAIVVGTLASLLSIPLLLALLL